MAELLIELFSEEIPARMQAKAAEDLHRLVTQRLAANGIVHATARSYVTPRRLTLVVEGIPPQQEAVTEERRGPRVGAPQAALDGFLKAAGVTLEQCEQRDTGKGVFYFATIHREGRRTAEVLPELIAGAILEMPWPKSMRWAGHAMRWVRPLHTILAVFDGKPLSGGIALGSAVTGEAPSFRRDGGDRPFGATTRGHRFLTPGVFEVVSFAEYRDRLRAAHVVLDRDERKATILSEAHRLAAAEGLELIEDEGLLDEVAGLVEWPVLFMGRIDEQFMDVPPEVLITSMRTHQRYFALRGADGRLAPRFVVAANIVPSDGGATIVHGNERVLRARLSDAKFFWDQDRKTPLEERVPALKDIVFHAKLGTLADKVSRLECLAADLARRLGADADQARAAARLAKADLVTGMVGEFPELQGVMGRYYALQQGADVAIADAVAEHYKPLGPSDRCPQAPVSVCVALADKLDTLAGFFAIDEKPTGSKDPYALRRAALGVIRLIVENGLRLPLRAVLGEAVRLYAGAGIAAAAARAEAVPGELIEFFADRLKVVLRDQGVRHDLVDAVFALGDEHDLVRLLARVRALQDFVGSDAGANLLAAYRRATNIVRIEEKKDGAVYGGDPADALLDQEEEKALFRALRDARARAVPLLEREDFSGCMASLSDLRGPVDAFFDRVTVNTDRAELRANRLRLLSQIRATLDQVAEFSRVEG
ncbi:glycine--tRNA ligase subunit beta [Arenibaculum pallidiluteum]|uniref:glycine--tRNA ligase subunit beta n=1 Tax=Arenibaculum pallidiluteum TaxID=2812559 RepID=UPI001A96617A|nr:glycine--tRNA ligase subunit beta [Arenibaculum pallidiluteum]